MISLTVQGAAALRRQLERLPNNVGKKVVIQSLREGAKLIQRQAKTNVSVKSGKLKRSIRVRVAKGNKKGNYAVFIGTGAADRLFVGDTFYGAYVELGRKRAKSQGGSRAFGVSGSRKNISGRPFLGPAFESRQREARDLIMLRLSEGIRREATK